MVKGNCRKAGFRRILPGTNRLVRSVRQTHGTRVSQEVAARLDAPATDAVLADRDDRKPVFQNLHGDPARAGFFQFVHNTRRRGKALLGALVAALVA